MPSEVGGQDTCPTNGEWTQQRVHTSVPCPRGQGTECIAHVLKVLTEADPRSTVVSMMAWEPTISISRKAMWEALSGPEVLPFVRLFHGQPSQ